MFSQKGNFSLIVGILIGGLLIGGGVFVYSWISAKEGKLVETSSPIPSPLASSADWEVYKNAEFGFEISHPPKSTVNSNGKYTRIQNYTDEEVNQNSGRLEPGHYYLEIILSDPISCPELLMNPEEIEITGVKGFKGKDKGQEGDSGPLKPAVCINKNNTSYHIRVGEEYEVVSGRILDSFKFIN